ncbi:O-antigen ligase [Collinsella aerofaciens]|uniref:O-antigen polymerase n=2 Tax=Collinsella aerofaciens TaxID=74426 RepID=UPI001105B7DD|nr:O-antigen polymerase [Collinsella aerofaciens]MDB1900885.1 O-antigen ligase [Collinsella aerofaciens]MDB1905013.1 O-antigen ligase [Collinsella aerofaciens]
MELLFISLVCLTSIILTTYFNRTILTPLGVFAILWMIISLFSYIHLYGLYETETRSYLLIALGLFGFSLGCGIARPITVKRNANTHSYHIRTEIVEILICLSILFYAYLLYRIYIDLGSIDLYSIQRYNRTMDIESLISSSSIRLFGSFIAGPVSSLAPIVVIALFFTEGIKSRSIVETALLLTIKMLATGSRSTLLFLFMYGIIAYNINKNVEKVYKVKRIKKGISLKLLAVLVLGIVLFVAMTLSRNMQVWRSLYLDLAIPPIMFQKWSDSVTGYSFGQASLGGFFFIILYPVQLLLRLPLMPLGFQEVYDLVNSTVSDWIIVGSGVPANAYVSLFWYFYADLGVFGVFLGSLLFGMWCNWCYLSYLNNKGSFELSLCLLMFSTIVFSFVRLQFTLPNYALMIVLLVFVFYGRGSKQGNTSSSRQLTTR